MREQYSMLRHEAEQPRYFREQLFYNYIYKGPVLEWYMKIKVRLEKNYQLFHELLPSDGALLDIGCGYGFMTYMLHFASPNRHITGIDYDVDKISTASHCFSKSDAIRFIHTDALEHQFEKYDGIVLSDVLHYLQPHDQKWLLEKCISSLNADGIIVLRDGNKELGSRHKGTRFTEFISTRFYGFNKTSGHGLSFISGSFVRDVAASHGFECIEIDQSKLTSNIIFVIKGRETAVHETI